MATWTKDMSRCDWCGKVGEMDHECSNHSQNPKPHRRPLMWGMFGRDLLCPDCGAAHDKAIDSARAAQLADRVVVIPEVYILSQRARLCGEPLVRASDGPCETCGWPRSDAVHIGYPDEPVVGYHPFQPPLACPVHGGGVRA